jgi:hypothetical protein
MTEFSKYETAARFVRNLLGVKKLTPAQKLEVKQAVERHWQRKSNRNQLSPIKEPPKSRLRSEVTKVIRPKVKELYNTAKGTWAGGETFLWVHISKEPFASGKSIEVHYGRYSGRNAHLEINVQPAWRKYIGSVPELATAGGMLTTHAVQVKPDCWQASWVCQGRGFKLYVQSGYIVQIGNQFFHGKTEATARAVARKKAAFEKMSQRLRGITTVDQLILEFGALQVRRSDSLRSGNCQEGTDNWIERYFPDQDYATIKQLLTADSSAPVVAACKAAILRQNSQSNLPRENDAVLGGSRKSPRTTDAVLGSVSR